MLRFGLPSLLCATAFASSDGASAWIADHAVRLATTDPGAPLDDLAGLDAVVGDAHVVALGDATPGTHEFFETKQRIFEYLAERRGFGVLAIEASLPACAAIDRYIQTGVGDPSAAIEGLDAWQWDTEEMLDLVEWMRDFNASGAGHVALAGFDMTRPDDALGELEGFADRVDPDLAARVRALRSQEAGDTGMVGIGLPIAQVAGRHVELSADVKFDEVPVSAGFWMRAAGPGPQPTLAQENTWGRGIGRAAGWESYLLEMDVPPESVGVSAAVTLSGPGNAWFGDVRVLADGEPVSLPAFDPLDVERIPMAVAARRGFATDAWHAVGTGRLAEMVDCDRGRCLHVAGFAPRDASSALVDEIEEKRARYAALSSAEDVDRAIHDATVAAQGEAWLLGGDREEAMAENVRWIHDHQPPGARIAIWGHDADVARARGRLGSLLDPVYGDDLVVLASATAAGEYRAGGPRFLQSNPLASPPDDSVEQLLHATGIPAFVVDLQPADPPDPRSAALTGYLPMRSLGYTATDRQFAPTPVRTWYDGIVYVDETTPSRPIPRHPSQR